MSSSFFRAVAGRRHVRALRDESGAFESIDTNGKRARLFWSRRHDAESFAERFGGGRRLQVVEFSWEEFRDVVLPTLQSDGLAVVGDWISYLRSEQAKTPDAVRAGVEAEIVRRGDLPRVMDHPEVLARFGLVPREADLPEIRRLLHAEAQAERRELARGEDTALLLCVQLFSRGHLEDCLRIWDARSSGFDLGCYLDAQLMCGAGLERTRSFLEASDAPEAARALAAIREGDFSDFTPEKWLQRYRRYFGQDH